MYFLKIFEVFNDANRKSKYLLLGRRHAGANPWDEGGTWNHAVPMLLGGGHAGTNPWDEGQILM